MSPKTALMMPWMPHAGFCRLQKMQGAHVADTTPKSSASSVMPAVVVGGLLLAGFLMLTLLGAGARDRQLNQSQIGLGALTPWLNDQGITARNSHARLSPRLDALSLRVIPIFDLNLAVTRSSPETREDRIKDFNQRDLELQQFRDKLVELESVVLFPKWRGALIETGIAHEQSLAPLDRFSTLIYQLELDGLKLLRDGPEFSTETLWDDYDVSLFHAQRFDVATLPTQCRLSVGFGRDAMVITCDLEGPDHPVHFVADPDLMNNHGMIAAQNAAFTATYIKEIVGSSPHPVYIDNSPDLLTATPDSAERQDYDRGTEELSRFFMYPFSLFWAVLLIVLAVLFWRGSRRFGPVQNLGPAPRELSKRAAIAAKARLLRLSGNDGHMVSDFVCLQLQDLGARSFGGALGQGSEARFMALLARRDPELAQEFSTVTDVLINDGADMTPQTLDRHLATYQTLLKKVVQHYEPV
jgi:hypothetical protein